MPVEKHPMYVTATGLSCVASCFFIIACLGVSNDEGVIIYMPWAVGRFDGFYHGDCHFGLTGYLLKYDSHFTSEDHHPYGDCPDSWCKSCDDAGQLASMFIFAALWLSCGAAVLYTIVLHGHNKKMLKLGIVCAFIAGVNALCAAVACRTCYVKFVDFNVTAAGGTAVGHFSALGWLALVGCVLIFLSALISVVSLFFTQLVPDDHETLVNLFYEEHLSRHAKIFKKGGGDDRPRSRSRTWSNAAVDDDASPSLLSPRSTQSKSDALHIEELH